ncbi:MAG: sigma-70 family RNA polymerase sigma factor [Christensenella sp.]
MKKECINASLNKYPPFLSAEEEKTAGEQLKFGDVHIKELLIEHNLRIVFFVARKYAGKKADFEDLMSVGSIGLIKAVNSFDSSKNIRFATYASVCIRNEILMYLRKTRNIEEIPFEDNVISDNMLGINEDTVWQETERRAIYKNVEELTSLLSPSQRKIVVLRFGLFGEKERTQKEVSEIVGVSQSCVSKVEKKFLRLLRENMVDDCIHCEKR